MLTLASIALGDVAREENYDGVHGRAREIAEPLARVTRAADPENGRAGRHALTKLLRERRQRGVTDPGRAQTAAGKPDRAPAGVGRGRSDRAAGADPVHEPGQPGSTCRAIVERQKLVSGSERRRPRQQKVLNVVELQRWQHVVATASGRASRRTPA